MSNIYPVSTSDLNHTMLLQSRNLSASYGNKEVLHSVSASFTEGEYVFILGPNGSGKSTFLTQLAGLTVPSLKIKGGECLLSEKTLSSYSTIEKARLISFLPQHETYTWNYSVLEAVRMGRYAQSTGLLSYTGEDTDAARAALSKAGIAHLEERSVFELSGGELQSVQIARSLAQNTKIMLLDEPFTFLDAGKSDKLIRFLKEIAKEEHKCIIMSIHDINLAPLYADRIILFSDGHILADGKPDEVFTEENIEKAYGTHFTLYTHPVFGVPQVCAQ